MKTLPALSLLLLCSTAWACDSYDSCIDTDNKIIKYYLSPTKEEMNSDSVLSNIRGHEYFEYHQNNSERALLKAIAYKLDEISKKIDMNGVTSAKNN